MFEELDDRYPYVSQLKDHEWFGEFYTKDKNGDKDAKFPGHIKYTINRGRSSGIYAKFMFTDAVPTDYNEVYGKITSPNDPKATRYYVKLVGIMRQETLLLDRKIQAAGVHYQLMLIHSEELLDIDIARVSLYFSELRRFFTVRDGKATRVNILLQT